VEKMGFPESNPPEQLNFTFSQKIKPMQVRKAVIKDSEPMAFLLMLATGEVIYRFIGERNFEKARDFLERFVKSENNQYSYQNCYVIEDEGEVIGALLGYEGEKLHELRKPVLAYIHQFFDPNLTVEDETQRGEYYIDSIGVLPTHQGKGLGARLIQFVIDEQVYKYGQTLGLLVDKGNPSAKKLYLRLGFEPVGEKTLMGMSLEHLQLKTSRIE
jgi:ribosomal protein S18 acetylase RimI-like enzyme